MKVKQLINSNGNATANQFVIEDGNKTIFQSYNSIICAYDWDEQKLTFGCDWDYSKTTMKHLNTFLGDYIPVALWGAENIRKAIKKGYHDFVIVRYDENLY